MSLCKRWFGMVGLVLVLGVAGQAKAELVARYDFSGNANDGSGFGHDGTVYDAVLTGDRFGNADKAYLFNGSGSYIGIPDAPDLNPTSALTVTAWFRADHFNVNEYSWPAILKKADFSQTNGYSMEIGQVYEGDPKIGFIVYLDGGVGNAGSDPTGTPASRIGTGTWHFAAGVWDGSDVSLYLGHDGVTLQRIYTSGYSGREIVPSSNDLWIGADPSNPFSDRFFDGAIDDVRIYNLALSEGQINELYSLPEPSTLILWFIPCAIGLIAVWRRRKAAR